MRKSNFFLLMTLLIVMPSICLAQATAIPDRYPNFGSGIRPMGMGNAFLTMPGTDYNGQFYNPASTDDFKQDWKFYIMNIAVDANRELYSAAMDFKNMAKEISDATTDAAKISAFQNYFNSHAGEFNQVNLRLPMYAMRYKHWAISLVTESNTIISMRNRAFPSIQFRSFSDAGLVVGTAWELFEGFQAGVNVKGLYRMSIDKVITQADIVAQAKIQNIVGLKQFDKGIGIGGDLGVKYTLPVLPELAAVVAASYTDIGDTRFFKFKAQNGGKPEKIPQAVNAGIGVHPEFGDFKLHVEASGAQLNQKIDWLLKTHAGAELEFPRLGILKLALRAGANQGYPTGGATLAFPIVKMNVGVFGYEAGKTKREKGVYNYGAEFVFQF